MDCAAAFDRARVLAARGSLEEALAALDDVLADDPNHAGALLLKAGALLEAREGEDALHLYERAVAAAPRSSEALNGLARCLHALARDDEALAVAEQAARAARSRRRSRTNAASGRPAPR